jgi:hypothetical protein
MVRKAWCEQCIVMRQAPAFAARRRRAPTTQRTVSRGGKEPVAQDEDERQPHLVSLKLTHLDRDATDGDRGKGALQSRQIEAARIAIARAGVQARGQRRACRARPPAVECTAARQRHSRSVSRRPVAHRRGVVGRLLLEREEQRSHFGQHRTLCAHARTRRASGGRSAKSRPGEQTTCAACVGWWGDALRWWGGVGWWGGGVVGWWGGGVVGDGVVGLWGGGVTH